jgi:wobble nucleotide-excising tRNase
MTISKIETIANLAVFNDFKWDTSVLEATKIKEFGKINIFYGRNYAGKTTLSRIFRALELGVISDKYDAPQFTILFKDGKKVDQGGLTEHEKNIRVFNEDFVRDNLRFINNPNDNIESFAILGNENNLLEQEIEIIQNEIGSDEAGQETGLQLQRANLRGTYKIAKEKLVKEQKWLEDKLAEKATDKTVGIKYQSDKFGDQNYTKSKLESDLSRIIDSKYKSLPNDEKERKEALIRENMKSAIPMISNLSLDFQRLAEETAQLVERPVGMTDKIEELLKESLLHRWANEGRALHINKHANCAFCGNKIAEERWAKLEKHFDQASDALKKEIELTIKGITNECSAVGIGLKIDKNLFYAKFHSELDALLLRNELAAKLYCDGLNNLKNQLETRQADILNVQLGVAIDDPTATLQQVWIDYATLRLQSNQLTANLNAEQIAAKTELRLREVEDFSAMIGYTQKQTEIKELDDAFKIIETNGRKISAQIEARKAALAEKKRLLNDEEKGAIKVNEFLNHYFGHKYLSLEAKQQENSDSDAKKIRFEVVRDGKKAFHLSEGECSLLAFCYFLAKLDDVSTKGSKPIIWIDDPISSLDNNHIFFIYSLLNAEIVARNNYEQLFISTHNLDFLKYLKRFEHKHTKNASTVQLPHYLTEFFVVERNGSKSKINLMPKYLREHITEFNYLFGQIFKCAELTYIDNENYSDFYNFGNNARKFLEILLFYKYPDAGKDAEKYRKFFGEGDIPSIFVSRVSNEYSHLAGGLERGALPIDVPEMHTTAKLILEKIKLHDAAQYSALLNSIGQ